MTAKPRDPRNGLKISATTATLFALIGHWFLGFEQSFLQLFVAMFTGWAAAIAFEWIDATANGRPPLFVGGGVRKLAFFLAPAQMTAVTTSFLLFVNDQVWVMVFAVVAAIGSKYIFKVTIGGRKRHVLNPSNFGIALTLGLFHWVSVIPYEFTEVFSGDLRVGAWLLPAAIVMLGGNLNLRYTKRLPLIGAFLGTFALQALLRSLVLGTPLLAGFMPMTGVAFLLFTFYMITDPATSPRDPRTQVVFGASIAVVYLLLMLAHVVFTLFFAVTVVSAVRGTAIAVANWMESRQAGASAQPAAQLASK